MLQNARKKASEGMCTDSHKEDRNRLDLVSIPYETSDKGMNEFTDQTRMSTDTKKILSIWDEFASLFRMQK